jgi:MoaA/NifB/PqqE/SkfB family radical SAM enzyme
MIEYQEPFFKRLKRKYRLLQGLVNGETAKTGPFWADIDITRRCNLHCLGCLYHSPLVTKSPEPNPAALDMPVDLARRAIHELAEMGTHSVIIQGAGEPLLHPGLLDIIAAVKEKGLFCHLFSNGTLLDRAQAEGLVKSGLDTLRISIWVNTQEGKEKSDDCQEILRKIVMGLVFLKEAKERLGLSSPQIELYQVVTRDNYRNQSGLIDLARKYDCAGVNFGRLITRHGQLDRFALETHMEEECIAKLADDRANMETQGLHHNIDRLSLRFCLGDKVWENAACFTPWFRLRVLVDGTVKICRGHDEAFGHLSRDNLMGIWNGPSLKAFRRRVLTRGGLAQVAAKSDCRACCFFCENLKVENIYRWFRPFVLRQRQF